MRYLLIDVGKDSFDLKNALPLRLVVAGKADNDLTFEMPPRYCFLGEKCDSDLSPAVPLP